jgi:hypothetical protein
MGLLTSTDSAYDQAGSGFIRESRINAHREKARAMKRYGLLLLLLFSQVLGATNVRANNLIWDVNFFAGFSNFVAANWSPEANSGVVEIPDRTVQGVRNLRFRVNPSDVTFNFEFMMSGIVDCWRAHTAIIPLETDIVFTFNDLSKAKLFHGSVSSPYSEIGCSGTGTTSGSIHVSVKAYDGTPQSHLPSPSSASLNWGTNVIAEPNQLRRLGLKMVPNSLMAFSLTDPDELRIYNAPPGGFKVGNNWGMTATIFNNTFWTVWRLGGRLRGGGPDARVHFVYERQPGNPPCFLPDYCVQIGIPNGAQLRKSVQEVFACVVGAIPPCLDVVVTFSGVVTVTMNSGGGDVVMADGSVVRLNAGQSVEIPPLSPPNTHDFDGTETSDILWRDTSGNTVVWSMNGASIGASGSVGQVPTTWQIVGQRDFDGDGKADLLWRDSSGNVAMWFMNGTSVASAAAVASVPGWNIVGTGDLNGDGKGDLLWRDGSGNTAVWLMNGANVTGSASLGNVPISWSIVGHADFDGGGKADILWRDSSGNVAIWFMNGASVASAASVANVGGTWNIAATGDFNGDGKADVLWRDTSGNTAIWLMNGASVSGGTALGVVAGGWTVSETGDFDGDGKSDILWRNTNTGDVAIWFMNGASVTSSAFVANVPPTWTIQNVNAN